MTEVKAEVPMSEMLSYAPDLRALTGGQGEYTLEFLRYEEIPAHLAQKVPTRPGKRPKPSHELLRGGRRPLLPSPRSVMARTRDIKTNQLDIACDVCGRTLLRGEHAEHYLAGGERRMVCDLCTRARSTRAGSASPGRTTSRCATRATRAAGGSFLERLRNRRERAREVQELREDEPSPPPPPRRAAGARAAAPAAPHPRRADQRRAEDAAGAGRVQRLRPHPHGRRRGPLAGRARGVRAPAHRPSPRSCPSP